MKRFIWDAQVQQYKRDTRVLKAVSPAKLRGLEKMLCIKSKMLRTKEEPGSEK